MLTMALEAQRPAGPPMARKSIDPRVGALLERALTHRDCAAAIAFLIRARHLVGLGTGRGGFDCALDWRWPQIDLYIDRHLGSRIHIEKLAESVELSVSHFHRLFRRHFGATPSAYIRERRVKTAEQFMRRRGQKLVHVALACGFADQAHFSRVFKKIVGVTPGAWRASRALPEGPPQLGSG